MKLFHMSFYQLLVTFCLRSKHSSQNFVLLLYIPAGRKTKFHTSKPEGLLRNESRNMIKLVRYFLGLM
jgi:hypothetical protein